MDLYYSGLTLKARSYLQACHEEPLWERGYQICHFQVALCLCFKARCKGFALGLALKKKKLKATRKWPIAAKIAVQKSSNFAMLSVVC